MAYGCPLCFRKTVTNKGDLCGSCKKSVGATGTEGPLEWKNKPETGPSPKWPKQWVSVRRTLHELHQRAKRRLWAIVNGKIQDQFDPEATAAVVALIGAMERASREERHWADRESKKGEQQASPENDELAISWLCRRDCPEETKRRALEAIAATLDEATVQ